MVLLQCNTHFLNPSLTVCCSVLQCVAVCCSVLQCVAVCCSVLQCVAVWCCVVLCVAVRVAVCCSVLQFSIVILLHSLHFFHSPFASMGSVFGVHCVAVRCSVLQFVAVCCSTVCCSVLQHFLRCCAALNCCTTSLWQSSAVCSVILISFILSRMHVCSPPFVLIELAHGTQSSVCVLNVVSFLGLFCKRDQRSHLIALWTQMEEN